MEIEKSEGVLWIWHKNEGMKYGTYMVSAKMLLLKWPEEKKKQLKKVMKNVKISVYLKPVLSTVGILFMSW